MHAQKLSHARQNYQERTLSQWLKVSIVGFLALVAIYTLTSLIQLQAYIRLKAEQKELIRRSCTPYSNRSTNSLLRAKSQAE